MAKLKSSTKPDENKVIRINSKVKIIMRESNCTIWVFEHPYMTFQRAVQNLCTELNETKTTTVDEWGFRLLYAVQEKGNPQN